MRASPGAYGASYTLNEVVLDKMVLRKAKAKKRILLADRTAGSTPSADNSWSSDPDQFAAAARLLADAGYNVIDINFGCPVHKVLGRCRGGFVYRNPNKRRSTSSAALSMRSRLTIPVTVKMRRGLDDTPESERSFFAILDGALKPVFRRHRSWPHRRTALTSVESMGISNQGQTTRRRWLGLWKRRPLPPPSCIDMMNETGVDGVTVARRQQPWIFGECVALATNQPRSGITEQRMHRSPLRRIQSPPRRRVSRQTHAQVRH
ncbi:MAG: tRNA-dihydrouridine synthase [Phycisphaerae bacterium]